MSSWMTAFPSAWDVVGFVLFVLVFPGYHLFYLWAVRRLRGRTARGRFDVLRESWIQRILDTGDVTMAAQQTRNLTMVSSILVSSSLILLGVTGNLLVQMPTLERAIPHPTTWDLHPGAMRFKLYLLIFTFVLAFSFCMTALRHLGNFILLIGADPALVEEHIGPPVKYFAGLINRASHRYTLGVRSFYAAFPLFVWLFDSRLFVALTLFWGLKFTFFQDFSGDRSKMGDTDELDD
ncbi:MAG: DUF599 domain-containing protein [Acidobacteria bacterium]|nr:DUF599 domain-containing protein [Acidobacteriota bacterium]